MRRVIIWAFILLFGTGFAAGQETGSGRELRLMFWNLENYFDWHRDSIGSGYDSVFTARGERHWTRKRFMEKSEAIAKAILWCATECGGLPDAIGFAEIENRFVLRCLLKYTILDKLDYGIVHFDSPDRRGIDVGLIYRKSSLTFLEARPVRISAVRGGDSLRTRDILVASFARPSGEEFIIAVNHHPSKFGGGESDWKRQVALDSLAGVAMSARGAFFVATGDFNDTPDDAAYRAFEAATGLVNLARPLADDGEGTIRFNGRWELIDMFFISPSADAEMRILRPPFLMTRDNVHSGDKPFRTYSGPRYIGGVSDHLPIFLTVKGLKPFE